MSSFFCPLSLRIYAEYEVTLTGVALTFSQMLFVTLHSLPSFITWGRAFIPSLKPRQVPVTQWALQVFVLTAGNLLTNWAYAFKVPLTIQIVFRSAGEYLCDLCDL